MATPTILQKFFSSHPECNPDDKNNYVGNYDGSCGKDFNNGAVCSLASNFGGADSNKSCLDSVTNQIQKVINGDNNKLGIKSCQAQLYASFVSQTMSELSSGEIQLQSALSVQQNYFDNSLKLMEAQVQSDINIENIVSGSIFILALVIVSYLLFSKIFV